jgi:hypothetical protein
MIRRIAGVLACALALTLLASASAQAAARGFTDGRGDVWRLVPHPKTRVPDHDQADITHLSLQHRQHQIVIRTRFAELNREGRYFEIFAQLRTNTGKVSFLALRARPNSWSGRTTFDRNDGKAVACHVTHHINYATNVAVVALPRTCIDNPRSVQAKIDVSTDVGRQTFTDNPINHRGTVHAAPYTAPVRVG